MEKQERLVTPIISPKHPAEHGSTVVPSAVATVIAVPEKGAYTQTKCVTNGLTKAAAQDYASNGIRISTILLRNIYTELTLPPHLRPSSTGELQQRRRDRGPRRHDELTRECIHDREQHFGRWQANIECRVDS
ncbi:hypothetical protein DFS33DRAFT_1388784 [Desarmillaria ectypa]|nr:hypothetical protein DFS33DRAFT_1388784 [Desarmillaria ectypa]